MQIFYKISVNKKLILKWKKFDLLGPLLSNEIESLSQIYDNSEIQKQRMYIQFVLQTAENLLINEFINDGNIHFQIISQFLILFQYQIENPELLNLVAAFFVRLVKKKIFLQKVMKCNGCEVFLEIFKKYIKSLDKIENVLEVIKFLCENKDAQQFFQEILIGIINYIKINSKNKEFVSECFSTIGALIFDKHEKCAEIINNIELINISHSVLLKYEDKIVCNLCDFYNSLAKTNEYCKRQLGKNGVLEDIYKFFEKIRKTRSKSLKNKKIIALSVSSHSLALICLLDCLRFNIYYFFLI